MPAPDATSRNLTRTIVGALVGVVTSLICWIGLFLLATFDDSAHWKGTLIFFGILLPSCCVAGGVMISHAYRNRFNYAIANIGIAILATLLASATIMVSLSLPISTTLLLSVPMFFGWAFVEERYISAIINTWVERLAGPPP